MPKENTTPPKRKIVRRKTVSTNTNAPKTMKEALEKKAQSIAGSPKLDPKGSVPAYSNRDKELQAIPAFVGGPAQPKNYSGREAMRVGQLRYSLEFDEGMMEWLYLLAKGKTRQSLQSYYDKTIPEHHDLTMRVLNECYRSWTGVHGVPEDDAPKKVGKIARRKEAARAATAKPKRRVVRKRVVVD